MQNDYLSEQSKWEKIESEQSISVEMVRHYKSKRVVSKKELGVLWEVNAKTIQRYVKDGMPICEELSKRLFQIFFLEECEDWKGKSINKSQSLKANKSKTTDQEVDLGADSGEEDVDLENVSVEEAERRLKIKDNIIKDYKIKELSGDLIPSDTTDKVTAEFNAGIVSWYLNHRDTLARDMEQKTKAENFDILDEVFGEFIKSNHKTANQVYDEELITKYELLQKIEQFMEEEPMMVAKFLNGF